MLCHCHTRHFVHVEANSHVASQPSPATGCVQAYLVFGEVEYLDMFSKVYISAMHGLRLKLLASAPPDSPPPPPWLADADMDTGKLAQPWISSLSAFWPGLQALAGYSILLSSACICTS